MPPRKDLGLRLAHSGANVHTLHLGVHLNIAILELNDYPIFVAVQMFASQMTNSYIIFHCDKQAINTVINSQTFSDPAIMSILRPLVLTLMQHIFSFAVYIFHQLTTMFLIFR